jgi:hypothetical protein
MYGGEMCPDCIHYPGKTKYCFTAGACIQDLYLPCCDCYTRRADDHSNEATEEAGEKVKATTFPKKAKIRP